ncbi:MAG: pitrilysin family protein [Gemmatimonadaceae bacterium]
MIAALFLAAAFVSGDSATSDLTVGGLRVILRRSTASEVVAVNLYLLGGSRQVTDSTAGIERFLLTLSERGTRRYPRDLLRRATARNGANITIEPTLDWTMVGLRTLAPHLDSAWAVYAERILHPVLDSMDVEYVRAMLLADVRQHRDSPDDLLQSLSDSTAFIGHPYAHHPRGTTSSLARITMGELRRYHDRELVTSRLLLVVVGNVTQARIEALVRHSFGTLPHGSYRWSLPPAITPREVATITVVARSLPTNYILGLYAGPVASSTDAAALRVACAVLSGRLFTEVRTRRNLTYAIDAPFLDHAASAGGFYVTTTSPDTVLALIAAEVHSLQTTTVAEDQLKRLVAQFVTTYFLENETNAAQANFLARHALYSGDYRAARRFVDDLRRVSPEAVRYVARQYIHGTRFVYLGDPTVVSQHGPLGL